MANQLKHFILAGHFEEAKKISSSLSYKELDDELMESAFKCPSITHYAFIMSLIVENEKLALHEIAFNLLIHPLCHIEGAYYAALYHTKRSIELTNQQDVGYLMDLLFLHNVPDTVVSEEEAYNTAKKILLLDRDNEIAKDFLQGNL